MKKKRMTELLHQSRPYALTILQQSFPDNEFEQLLKLVNESKLDPRSYWMGMSQLIAYQTLGVMVQKGVMTAVEYKDCGNLVLQIAASLNDNLHGMLFK